MTLSGRQYPIAAGPFEAVVTEVGAGLRRFSYGDRDVTRPYGEDELTPKGCGAVLVPWPNRISGGRYRFDGVDYQLALTEPDKGNASHGLARWARWTPLDHAANRVTMTTGVVPQPGWPFELTVVVTYALDPELGLSVSARALNAGVRRMPFGMGFHPYIATGTEPMSKVAVRLAAAERIVTDDQSIPIGRRRVDGTPYDLAKGSKLGSLRLDDAFTGLGPGRTTVEVTAGRQGARVWMDEAFPYTQLFTNEVLGGVAVEPMTCPANAFNSGDGLIVLEPGQAWAGNWGIQPI
jgi:aldose 1-epimerase